MAEFVFVLCLLGAAALAATVILGQRRATPVQPAVGAGEDIVEMPRPDGKPPQRPTRPSVLKVAQVQKAVDIADRDGEPLVILNNASLELYPGEVVCISGLAGRGKSTLLRILAFQDSPSAGTIIVGDRVVSTLSRVNQDDVLAAFIHYIPQKNLGLLSRSPVENITHLLTRLDGVKCDEARRRAESALTEADLPRSKFYEQLSETTFSGGQQARVAIAMAFARARPVVLADEIFANLDEPSAKDLIARFKALAVTHDMAVAVISHNEHLWNLFDRHLRVGHDKSVPRPDEESS